MNLASIASHPWAYPVLEIVHLLGIALLVGNLFLVELRVWGLGRTLAIEPLAAFCLRLVASGAGLCVVSGILMFASQAAELLANRLFTLKMLLLAVAASNAVWFHLRGSLARLDATARLSALASMLIWIAIVSLGRWIGYV